MLSSIRKQRQQVGATSALYPSILLCNLSLNQTVCYCDHGRNNDHLATHERKEKNVQEQGDWELRHDQPKIIAQQEHPDHSCWSCLVVGVATCTGLAAYFTYMAFEPPPVAETGVAAMLRKPTFLSISVGWMCLGIYRIYLG
jgi:hypothetical protein